MSSENAMKYAEFLRGQAQRCRRLADLNGTSGDIAASLRKMALDYERQAAASEAGLPAPQPAEQAARA